MDQSERAKRRQERVQAAEKDAARGNYPHCPCGKKLGYIAIRDGEALCIDCRIADGGSEFEEFAAETLQEIEGDSHPAGVRLALFAAMLLML